MAGELVALGQETGPDASPYHCGQGRIGDQAPLEGPIGSWSAWGARLELAGTLAADGSLDLGEDDSFHRLAGRALGPLMPASDERVGGSAGLAELDDERIEGGGPGTLATGSPSARPRLAGTRSGGGVEGLARVEDVDADLAASHPLLLGNSDGHLEFLQAAGPAPGSARPDRVSGDLRAGPEALDDYLAGLDSSELAKLLVDLSMPGDRDSDLACHRSGLRVGLGFKVDDFSTGDFELPVATFDIDGEAGDVEPTPSPEEPGVWTDRHAGPERDAVRGGASELLAGGRRGLVAPERLDVSPVGADQVAGVDRLTERILVRLGRRVQFDSVAEPTGGPVLD